MNSEPPAALLFPGQGAQHAAMLQGLESLPTFELRLRGVERILGHNPLDRLARSPDDYVHANLTGSLLTILASVTRLDSFLKTPPGMTVKGAAGYSVGQWTAMFAAGMLAFEDLLLVIHERTRLMDRCCEESPGAMLAVIGVPLPEIERRLAAYPADAIVVSNYNCVGQYTLSGTPEAISSFQGDLATLRPKKLLRLPMAGAWHSPLMEPAAERFDGFLRGVAFNPPAWPVFDNVTGRELPSNPRELRASLARHLCEPVRWEDCVRGLLNLGAERFFEVGEGSVLTKFGFFISREASFVALER